MSGYAHPQLYELFQAVVLVVGLAFVLAVLFEPGGERDEPSYLSERELERARRHNARVDWIVPCLCWTAICGFWAWLIVTAIV